MSINEIEVARMPAGTYYISDPCYIIHNDQWMEALDDTWYFGLFSDDLTKDSDMSKVPYRKKHEQNGMFRWKGYYIAASSTSYGDGCYKDEDGNEYGVDAGMIGAVPVEYCDEFDCHPENLDLLHKHTFETEWVLRYSGGVIKFGNDISIDTEY